KHLVVFVTRFTASCAQIDERPAGKLFFALFNQSFQRYSLQGARRIGCREGTFLQNRTCWQCLHYSGAPSVFPSGSPVSLVLHFGYMPEPKVSLTTKDVATLLKLQK